MAGHSRSRFDVYTDAGRPTRGDLYLLYRDVSPSQAYNTQRWLELEGWRCEVRPSEPDLLRRPAVYG